MIVTKTDGVRLIIIMVTRADTTEDSIPTTAVMSLRRQIMNNMTLTWTNMITMSRETAEAATGVDNPEVGQQEEHIAILPQNHEDSPKLLITCLQTITQEVMWTVKGVIKMQFQRGHRRYSHSFETRGLTSYRGE